MDYRTRSNVSSRGFSLIELLVVIGIMSLFAMLSATAYTGFRSHENLQIATAGVVEALRFAQASAQSGKGDSMWGVRILPGSLAIFKGASYAGRDTSADQPLNFPGGVTATGLSDVAFETLTGEATDTGVITLTNSYGVQDISINAKGTITY